MSEKMRGLLGLDPLSAVTANQNMMNQGILARNKAPFQMKPNTPQGLLDGAALASSPIPILGDLIGLGADGYRFATDPSSRTPANFGLSALGALPFVPPATAIFAGALAKTAKLDKKALAEGMEAAGRSRDDIWKETGWFKGPEGKWKFEIDDSVTPTKMDSTVENFMFQPRVGEYMDHKQLYDAYPSTQMFDIRNGNMGGVGTGGSFVSGNYGGGSIRVDAPYFNDKSPATNAASKSTVLHELQHGVQDLEGFAKGGSPQSIANQKAQNLARINFLNSELSNAAKGMDRFPKGSPQYDEFRKTYDAAMAEKMGMNSSIVQGDPYDGYRKLAGEAEARAVQTRMNMNPAQRQAVPPWQSYDIPWEQLIIK